MLWSALWRRKWERELDAEMRFHLEQQVQDYVAEGLTEQEAWQKASREFGAIELAKDECRDERPLLWLEQAMQDCRHAARLLLRSPSFATAALLSLALGIGATTSVFSVVDHVLFRSLPYRDAERLVSVGIGAPMLPYEFLFGASYLEFRTHQTFFEAVTSWSGVNDCDLTEGEPVRLTCAAVESSFLSTMGIAPALGRGFTAEDDGPNRPRAVLISFDIWRGRFAQRPDILGQTISLDGKPSRVAGVLPAEFETPTLAHADMVIPQGLDDAMLRRAVTGRPLRVLARLPRGATMHQAQAAGDLMLARALEGAPAAAKAMTREVKMRVRTLRDLRVGDVKVVSWVLFGSVIAVLLLACASVANLLLARTIARQRELSVRMALGASRSRLVRQAIAESLLLAFVGGVAGLVFAYGLLELFIRVAPEGIPQLTQAGLDSRVLAFTILCSLACSLLFGMGPAFASVKGETLSASRSVAGGRGLLRQTLIVVQLSLSLTLLTGAGLLARTLWRFQQVPLGIEPEQILTASLSLSPGRYPEAARQLAFSEQLEERLHHSGGFTSIAISDSRPPDVPLRSKPLAVQQVDGHPQESPAQGTVVWRAVTPSYFRTLGIPIRRGRGFTEEDRAPGRNVVIVSESLARRLFHGSAEAVGHTLGGAEIIGVAGDVRNSGGTTADDPEYYVARSRAPDASIYSAPGELRHVVAIVRTPLAAAVAGPLLRNVVTEADSSLPVQIEAMQERTGRLSVRPRFNALLLTLFAGIGLALSAFGLYGVLGFLVAQRTREIGLRMALGATPGDVSWLVLGSTARWLCLGIVCGWILSAGLSRALNTLLFGISTYDPLSWMLAAGVLVATALAAAWQPSRRAARVDPVEALRHE
jgi:putative ABC transport system permease protein